jgi:hypothetical protein
MPTIIIDTDYTDNISSYADACRHLICHAVVTSPRSAIFAQELGTHNCSKFETKGRNIIWVKSDPDTNRFTPPYMHASIHSYPHLLNNRALRIAHSILCVFSTQ